MKTRNTALPSSRVVVDTRGSKTTVALWNGGFVETVNQDGLVEYEYEVLHIETRLRPNLAEIIEGNFDVWYEAAKEIEETPKTPNLTLEELAEKMFVTQKQLETSQEALDFIIMEGM
jgi:hypothetical protein